MFAHVTFLFTKFDKNCDDENFENHTKKTLTSREKTKKSEQDCHCRLGSVVFDPFMITNEDGT